MKCAAVGALALGLLVACHAPPRWERPAPRSAVVDEAWRRFQLGDVVAPGAEADPVRGSPVNASAPRLVGDLPPDAAGGLGVAPATIGEPATRGAAPVEPLDLASVLLSVEQQFPLVLAALEQVEIARGSLLASEGAFDTKLEAGTLQETEGFYDGDEYDIKVEQPTTLWGLAVTGGWRRGEGSFAVYDGKRKTNAGGEWKLGARLPLLQGGRVDELRVAMWKARLEQEAAEPAILRKRLEATRKAAEAYWKWVAWGAKAAIGRRLLENAETRQAQVRAAVDAGELAEIDAVDNKRLIVDRRSKLASIERGLQQAAILLSLYWRDPSGAPLVPGPELLPADFPEVRDPALTVRPGDELLALTRRPELRELELEREALLLDGELFDNQLLPRLDLAVEASQDVGSAVNTPDDKGDFEMQASLRFQLPLQRRKPEGKRIANLARRAKLDHELRFLADVVVSEVRDAASALRQTWVRLDQARQNVELARQLEDAERLQLELGESDLFRVNLREKQSAQAASALVDVLAEHFQALVGYRAVLGIPYDEVLAGRPVLVDGAP